MQILLVICDNLWKFSGVFVNWANTAEDWNNLASKEIEFISWKFWIFFVESLDQEHKNIEIYIFAHSHWSLNLLNSSSVDETGHMEDGVTSWSRRISALVIVF